LAKAYFIGGAPRTGKSTLAKLILRELPAGLISTDEIRTSLRHSVPASAQPDLYYLDSLNADEAKMAEMMRTETFDIIEAADRESAVIWPAVQSFVREHLATGRDVLVEGVAVLPEFIADLNFDYSVVFLGNQSPAHAALIQDYAREHPDSWLGGLEPDTIDAFATFSAATSAHIEREARKYYLPYIEMGKQPFDQAIEQARRLLLG
jgi:hypothetical protein